MSRLNRDLLLGLLLGLLIMPPTPAQAQIFGPLPVTDLDAYVQRVEAKLEKAREWVQKVAQWEQSINNAIQQLTTLKGVLGIVDKQLARDIELAHLTKDVAAIVQGSYQLQNKVRSMVHYEITSLEQIDTRLNQGIFDPEKDQADLNEYLLYTMGRNAQQTIALAVQSAKVDTQLNAWNTERQKVAEQLAKAQTALQKLIDRADLEQTDPDPIVVDHITVLIKATIKEIEDLQQQLNDLDAKINQRMNQLGVRLSDMENFGYSIESTQMMWPQLNQTKDQISNTLDAALSQTAPVQ